MGGNLFDDLFDTIDDESNEPGGAYARCDDVYDNPECSPEDDEVE